MFFSTGDPLKKLVHNGNQLITLLNCECLSEFHVERIYIYFKDKFNELIQNADELLNLLNCVRLNGDDRAEILTILSPHLAKIIQNFDNRSILLACKNLTGKDRQFIMKHASHISLFCNGKTQLFTSGDLLSVTERVTRFVLFSINDSIQARAQTTDTQSSQVAPITELISKKSNHNR